MTKAFHLIETQNKIYCDSIKKEILFEEWMKYVAFIFENKEKNIKLGYFSNAEWGEEYANNLHAVDPVRGLCKASSSRTVIWGRMALDNHQQDFMSHRQQKCGINEAITINLSHGDEFKLLTLAASPHAPSLEEYFSKNMRKILDLSCHYTKLMNAITLSS